MQAYLTPDGVGSFAPGKLFTTTFGAKLAKIGAHFVHHLVHSWVNLLDLVQISHPNLCRVSCADRRNIDYLLISRSYPVIFSVQSHTC